MFADISSVMQTYLLGVKQTNENGRYCLRIEPYLDGFDSLKGSVATVNGKVVTEYKKVDGGFDVCLEIPYGVDAVFVYNGKTLPLTNGFVWMRVEL